MKDQILSNKTKGVRIKFLETYYQFWSDSQLFSVTEAYNVNVYWVVEAGCHDGTDTLELSRRYNPINYFAFEPDPVAYLESKKIIHSNSLTNVTLFQEGLGHANSKRFLNYLASGKGSGSTFLTEQGQDEVSICRLDDKLPVDLKSGGLLWLDVEGYTVNALAGMTISLKKIDIAKVEVQLHSRNDNFKQDFAEILDIFQQAGMVPLYGPIFPGFFGDIIFIRKSFLGLRGRLRSKFLLTQLLLLHTYIYPAIGKPAYLPRT